MRRHQRYTLRITIARGLLGALGVWLLFAAWLVYFP